MYAGKPDSRYFFDAFSFGDKFENLCFGGCERCLCFRTSDISLQQVGYLGAEVAPSFGCFLQGLAYFFSRTFFQQYAMVGSAPTRRMMFSLSSDEKSIHIVEGKRLTMTSSSSTSFKSNKG